MTDTDYTPSFRTQPRPTDAEKAAMEAYCEELRAAIAAEGQKTQAELAAQWPQSDKAKAPRR